ncbi:outer membrane beta-barrel protein [Algoriphagus hitonicola]|uniref:Outer membrane protein beta-barrel domain-containing protein n=1 Tax=Algoriphagus hitonicola TaxID=435880 RepID=A0A1I2QFV3_9BACT|nr:outer membrane beta-barrel protein [Algoriphagus hitonicola]SFG26850.1 Outer membrane protein beta-barrel domain-containing protein [Algoriphagus hitonicola]
MKKLLILIPLYFSISIVASGQAIKPTLGLNFSDVKSADDVVNGSGSWQIGLSMEFGKKMYVEPGIFFMSRSYAFENGASQGLSLSDPKFKGIRIPVSLGAYIIGNEESTFAWRGFVGPSAFLYTDTGDINPDELNSPAWGVFAGTGLNIWILFVDLSYEWSVNDISPAFAQIDFGRTNGFFAQTGFRLKF